MPKLERRPQFAIIGCGRIAQRHAEHIQRVGKIVADCDLDIEKAQSLTEVCGATPFTKFQEMLESSEIDTVSVCSRNGLHARVKNRIRAS